MKRLAPVLTLVLGIVMLIANHERPDIAVYVALVISFAIVDVFGLTLARGGEVRFDGGLAVAAVGLLPVVSAASALLVGFSAARLIRREENESALIMLTGTLARGLLILGLAIAMNGLAPSLEGRSPIAVPLGLLAVGAVFMLLDLALYSVLSNNLSVSKGLARAGGLIRIVGAGYAAQVSVGVVMVQVFPRLQILALVVLVPLMLIMRQTTEMLIEVRSAYMRTVGALAQVAEVQAGANRGHAYRVSTMATAAGRRLGLGSQQLERLAFAALLHDIGRVRSRDGASEQQVADASAELLSRISFLAGLSPIVRRRPLDYEDYIDASDMDGRLARLIRLSSDIDDLMTENGTASVSTVIDEVDRRGSEAYDPVQLETLRVLAQSGEI